MSTINTPPQLDVTYNGRTQEPGAEVLTLNRHNGSQDQKLPGIGVDQVNAGVNTAPPSSEQPKALQEALSQIRDQVQTVRRELEFSIDEELQKVIITVHDSESGDVIRQIPSEEFIRMARAMNEAETPHILDAQA